MKTQHDAQHSERSDATGTSGDTRTTGGATQRPMSAQHNPWRHTPQPISQADGTP